MFGGISTLVSVVVVVVCIPTTSVGEFLLPHPLGSICSWFFDDGRSFWGRMIYQCSFNLLFSSGQQCWIFFAGVQRIWDNMLLPWEPGYVTGVLWSPAQCDLASGAEKYVEGCLAPGCTEKALVTTASLRQDNICRGQLESAACWYGEGLVLH